MALSGRRFIRSLPEERQAELRAGLSRDEEAPVLREWHSSTRAVVNKLLDTARNIKTFPNAGRIVPELGDEAIRERFVYSYRLIYRVEDHEVLIVAVVHGRRLLEPLLEQINDG